MNKGLIFKKKAAIVIRESDIKKPRTKQNNNGPIILDVVLLRWSYFWNFKKLNHWWIIIKDIDSQILL